MASAAVTKNLLDLALLKNRAKEIAHDIGEAESRLIESMHKAGQKTTSVSLPSGDTVKGTLVEPQTVVIDEDRLKKALGAKQWAKVTKTVLDKVKLEAAVALGDIDTPTIASVSTIKDIKPSVRVSGTFAPAEAEQVKSQVSIRDASGKVKPAAKRLAAKA